MNDDDFRLILVSEHDRDVLAQSAMDLLADL